jgi:hypothetical protein
MKLSQKTHDLYNQYLLDSIDFSGYELEIKLKTNQQLINQLFKTFEKEGGWQVDRIGFAPALTEWLSGLPSCINIDFANYDILERAKKYGSLAPGATEKDQDKLLSNYWDFMANKLIKLHNGRGVKALLSQAV